MRRAWWVSLFLLALPFGCGGQEPIVTPGVEDDAAVEDALVVDDGATATETEGVDAAPFPVRRLPCVGRTALATDLPNDGYGALEGELVSVVPPGTKNCPSDADHLHLQILVGTKRYDAAITIDSSTSPPLAIQVKTLAPALPAPGWANDTFDYEKQIAIPSADFKPLAKAALLTRLQTELATASRVRLFGRGYTDGTGTHFIHRNGRDRDGVVIVRRVDPGGADRAIALRFANQVF